MWGNRQGWIISASIVLVVGLALGLIARGPDRTAPTTFSADPQNFQALDLPELSTASSPELSAAAPPIGGPAPDVIRGDADAAYRAAIQDFRRQPAPYEDFAATGNDASAKEYGLIAVDEIVSALSSRTFGGLFSEHPEELINYQPDKPPLEALEVLGRVLVDRLALRSEKAGDRAAAMKYASAAYMLGLRLCRERICYAELELGLQLTGKSAPLLARLAEADGNAALAAAYRDFDARRVRFVRERVEPVVRIVRSIDPAIVGPHVGDLFELAKRSQERMWRVEAILALGRERFLAGEGATAADQRAATRLVTQLAESDPDPAIRAAATAARDLTLEQHRAQ
jgi:hypothetical protein